MKELLLEQQLGTLNRFRSGTLRRCHHRMTDRRRRCASERKRQVCRGIYLILISLSGGVMLPASHSPCQLDSLAVSADSRRRSPLVGEREVIRRVAGARARAF